MNSRVLTAGWPFAGLLALDAGRADAAQVGERLRGLVVGIGGGIGIVALESGGATDPIVVESSAAFFGVDGYPIRYGDIHVGDLVETVREKRGPEMVTTQVRMVGAAPSRPERR